MLPLRINELSFQHLVLKSDIPFFLVFGADWNIDSLALYEDINKYCEKVDGLIRFGIVDYDYLPEIFCDYKIMEIPTIMIIEDGKEFARKEKYGGCIDIETMLYKFFGYLPFTPEFINQKRKTVLTNRYF